MSTITEVVEFPVERLRWSALDGKLRAALIASSLVGTVGGCLLFIGMLTSRAFQPLSGWGDLLLLVALIAMATVAIRNVFESVPQFVTRAYLVTTDSLLIENYQKTIRIPFDNIDTLEPISLGWPSTPLRSAIRVQFHRPIGFRLSIDVFPSRSAEFFEALAQRCPRLAPFIPAPEATEHTAPVRFTRDRDFWDNLDFYLPLVVQVPLFMIIGIFPFPAMLWLIGMQLGNDLPHSSVWQTAILVLLSVCLALQGYASILSLVRRVHVSLIRNYVLTDQGVVFEARSASPCVPWSNLSRFQPSKVVRLLGLSLKPAYRLYWKSAQGETGAIDLTPLDRNGFLEAARERCPRLLDESHQLSSTESR